MNATRTAAAAALAAGLAGSACTATRTPTAVITIAPVQAPAEQVTATPSPTRKPEAKTTPSGEGTVDFLGGFTDSGDPKGTPVELTIRYLNALRAGKWTAAVKDMAAVERAYIRIKDNAAEVGRDVLAHAAGARRTLPRCTSGVTAARDAVAIRRGDLRVMVHVETWRGFRGVKVDEVFVPSDHYGHPHTHAYTALLS